jgi:hypothetical protein
MANTYKLIEKKVLLTAAASVEFTSIPATYTDLIVLVSCRLTRSVNGGQLNVNFNSSSSDLTGRYIYTNGSSITNGTNAGLVALVPGSTTTANTFSNFQLYVPNYAGSNNKSWTSDFGSENNSTTGFTGMVAGLWSQTAAITAIKFVDSGAGNLEIDSSFYLYGIKNS